MVAKSVVTSRDAQTHKAFKEIVTKEKAEVDAKTARLRALRLARDAEPEDLEKSAAIEDVKPKAKKAPKRRSFA